MAANAEKHDGFALLAVLWALTICSIIAAVLLGSSRAKLIEGRGRIGTLESTALADAGIAIALRNLLNADPASRWRLDGSPINLEYSGHVLEVSIQDEDGKIDLRHGLPNLISLLFQSAGLSSDNADAEADRVEDWQDAGPGRRLNGAKAAEYREAGLRYVPRAHSFESIEELNLVLGVNQKMSEQIIDGITIYSDRQIFNLATATLEALLTNNRLDPEELKLWISRRHNDSFAQPANIEGHVLTIHCKVSGGSGFIFDRSATLRITGAAKQPYVLYKLRGKENVAQAP